ncbi:radical SAM protein [uncultured Arcobacter sp.]|uniref:radical SAM protein n=1 Tax=uncultured Arcobacter sp. TaxID=165434 RepID=UPI002607D8DA|nr:radical SAM protein [uncultured Arcobacter sp.]
MIERLEDIGFYTMDNNRAKSVSTETDLWRCELILTDTCNFKCPYCRGVEKENKGMMSWDKVKFIIDMWGSHNLRNVRFSGGEPTMWKYKGHFFDYDLVDVVKHAKSVGIDRIAISTNGSADQYFYERLIHAGVTDFSISLDACCAEEGDKMAGDIKGSWDTVIGNIKFCASHTYTTVGVVFTEDTINTFNDVIAFASDELGVDDIRILSSAQWNEKFKDIHVDEKYLAKHPILKYRVDNFKDGRHVRGIEEGDCDSCKLMLDDMAILADKHYPCIIYMREQGKAIGEIDYTNDPYEEMIRIRKERKEYIEKLKGDSICKKNCLDVCIDYNNIVDKFQGGC